MRSEIDNETLGFYERMHMRHRMFRYRFRSERPSIEYLLDCDLGGKTLVDVGANHGIYSCYLSRKAGSSGALFAFEPQPELHRHLMGLKNSFHLDNLTIVNKGLSSRPAVLNMTRPFAGSGEAGINLPDGMFDEEIKVEVIVLDEYFDSRIGMPVAFLKADVQGHEYDVFKGARGVLEEDRPVLLFEHFDHEAKAGEIFSLLSDLGYDGWFYFVRQQDHLSLLRSGRGKFVNFMEYDKYEHVRPEIDFRNYIFAHKDSREGRALEKAAGIMSRSAAVSRINRTS